MEVALSDRLASPVVKASEYEAKLREFGQLWSVAVAPDGSRADLVPTSASPGGRLIGVQVAEGLIAIVPSGRFVKDFSMTFKESLEAGADVKTMFDCRVDGSAALKIKRIAYARVVDEGRLTGLHKGELMGFVA